MTQSELYTYARNQAKLNATDWAESDLLIDLNDALDLAWVKLKELRGILEYDDTNYTDLPSATFSVSGSTNRYKITKDENSNEIITIHKVQITNSDGNLVDIPRLNVGEPNQDALGTLESDFPTGYYEIGSTVAFNSLPDGTYTAQVWFDRAPKHMVAGGTTFVPGIPSVYHKFLAHNAVLSRTDSDKITQKMARLLQLDLQRIEDYESSRRSDETSRLVPHSIDAR